MSHLSFLTLSLSTVLALYSATAQAQIQIQPIEVIEEAPPTSFSDRSGLWPSVEFGQDYLHPEGESRANYLNSVPGLQARETGSPTISIRGSAQADRVLQLFEGVPLNLADGVGANNLFIPVEALGSLRLFKGPASVFFGSSAVGGAIDHRLRLFERTAVRFGLADDSGLLGTRNLFAALPLSLGSGTKKNTQFTAFHQFAPGRYEYQSVSQPMSGRRENNGSETLRMTATGDYASGEWKLKPLLLVGRSIVESPNSLTNPTISTTETKGSLLSLNASRKYLEGTQFNFRAADVRTWSSGDDSQYGHGESETSRTSFAVDLDHSISNQVTTRTFLDLEANASSSSFYANEKYTQNDIQVGQSYEISFADNFLFQPAFRYTNAAKELMKAASIQYHGNKRNAWLSYSEGFRSPSVTDLHADTPFSRANPDLKPERSQSIELGYLSEGGRRFGSWIEGLSYGGSIYSIHYTDAFAPGPGPLATKINLGSARANGAEASLAYAISAWTFTASHSWLDAKNEDSGQRLTLSPVHQTTLSISQQLGPAVFELKETIWSSYTDVEYTPPATSRIRELPGWQTLDLNVRTIGLMDWEFKGGVTNLFNEPRELTIGFPEPQRRFYFSALRYF